MQGRKKIGVITHPTITNYGGILQAYALQATLVRMGFDAEVIEKRLYPRQLTLAEKLFVYPYRFFKKKILHKECQIRHEKLLFDEIFQKKYEGSTNTMLFVDKHIRHKYVYDYSELKADDYYAIIVGSDQIWRPKYMKGMNMTIENAYLDFAKGWRIKRISYAASFGAEQWEYNNEQTKSCKDLLSAFDAVSCREYSGEQFCKSYLGYPEATTVLDPTMLFNSDDYLALCDGYQERIKQGIMCYILDKDDRSESVVSFVKKKLGMETFEVRAKSNAKDACKEDRLQPPVEEWIKGFQNASFVVTDSFHACVFSILFQKPFIVLVNHDRGTARYDSLLGQFGMSYRIVESFDETYLETVISKSLEETKAILSERREYSLNFLKNSLGVNTEPVIK
ncbi:MAG: polysaccharide pyruvyl transferase family protein [Bacteroidales bacterium]|nr:polysaccharide pyruvyl transferase family protein [Bacteroidales bacterium]